METLIEVVERGWVPEPVVRLGIRRVIAQRLENESRRDPDGFVESLAAAPIAEVPEAANEQHYEVPARFYELVLGRQLKYSSGFWPAGVETLDDSERAMLELSVERADLRDGQRILELGCGWGSMTLWMAARFPNAEIVAVSNSASQREHILSKARARGITNIEIRTADMNEFDAGAKFDRVVSIEMFEHMRNWPKLLGRVRGWLEDEGRAFIHVFAHRRFAYPYDTSGRADWIGRTFFTGGMMPSVDLIERVPSPFSVEDRWIMSGLHYKRTADAWLAKHCENKDEIVELFARDMSTADATRQWERWRIFFYALSESFGYHDGCEWQVAHYRLAPKDQP